MTQGEVVKDRQREKHIYGEAFRDTVDAKRKA
jgi:hypothetical protein